MKNKSGRFKKKHTFFFLFKQEAIMELWRGTFWLHQQYSIFPSSDEDFISQTSVGSSELFNTFKEDLLKLEKIFLKEESMIYNKLLLMQGLWYEIFTLLVDKSDLQQLMKTLQPKSLKESGSAILTFADTIRSKKSLFDVSEKEWKSFIIQISKKKSQSLYRKVNFTLLKISYF